MDEKIVELRSTATKCKKGLQSEIATLKEVCCILGYRIYLDKSDIQSDPTIYILVGNLKFYLWRKSPEELMLFITDVFEKLGQIVVLTEIRRHGDHEAVCSLSVTSKDIPKTRTYRERRKCDDKEMSYACFFAILQAFFSALSQDEFLHI